MIYEINDLTFGYSKHKNVLESVNLSFSEGELITILGRNGSGKSTLFSLMLGINKPSSGNIMLDGVDLKELSARKIAEKVGFVPQSHMPTFDFTAFEFVLMGCASKVGIFSSPGENEKKAAEEAFKLLEIEEFKEKKFRELSGGEQQELIIARAIAAKPKVILFDEPTSHLDYANQQKVLRIIRGLSKAGFSCVITTHDPNHSLILGGKTAILDGCGGLVFGKTEETVTEENLKNAYDAEVYIRYLEEFNRNVCISQSIESL